MKLTLSFSPCPNDTYIFEPIVNKRIDLKGFEFDIKLEDVENLNKAALLKRPDISKISFNAFTKLYNDYQLLDCGSALGTNCGPLLISKNDIHDSEIKNKKIAIPGYNTTAFLLLKYAYPEIHNFEEILFSDIENSIIEGRVDAGVIIHENRFTYQEKGLRKIIDLGSYWEDKTGSPIPLGGIAVRRSLPEIVKKQINSILSESIAYAFDHPKSGMEFIKNHAQEMAENVMLSHINLYVNEFTKNLGQDGKKAIQTLFKIVIPDWNTRKSDLFVE